MCEVACGRDETRLRKPTHSATAPSTVNTILPVGVEVSTCSESEAKSMPSERNVSNARRRCETERAKRSNFQTKTHQNGAVVHPPSCDSVLAVSPWRLKPLGPRTLRQYPSLAA